MSLFSPELKYTITGKGGIIVFGDTHFSSIFQGEHINYQEECLDSMARILEIVRKEKPCAVALLGDLIPILMMTNLHTTNMSFGMLSIGIR